LPRGLRRFFLFGFLVCGSVTRAIAPMIDIIGIAPSVSTDKSHKSDLMRFIYLGFVHVSIHVSFKNVRLFFAIALSLLDVVQGEFSK